MGSIHREASRAIISYDLHRFSKFLVVVMLCLEVETTWK